VDLSGATTNAQWAELLRDADAATTTTASSGGGDGTGVGGDKDHGELACGMARAGEGSRKGAPACCRGSLSPRW
jgi:hypothetical protein